MLGLVFQNLTSDKKYNSKFFKKILVGAVKELKINKKNVEVSVNLVGEDKVRELNKKYRKKNKVTDVLSFPMVGNLKSLPTYQRTNLPALDLGDIFICLSIAKKEAKSENIDIEKKLAQLTVHGFLHLAGYDHERSIDDKKKMVNIESHILRKLRFG